MLGIEEETIKSRKSLRQKFSADEDKRKVELVSVYGNHSWKKIATLMEGRNTRQCRERYINYLSPNLINGPWTSQEDRFLIDKVKQFGQSWSKIVKYFPTRSDVNIKNRYALLVSKGKAPRFKSETHRTKSKKAETIVLKSEPCVSIEEIFDTSISEFQELKLDSKNDCPFNLSSEELFDLSFY